MRVIKIVHSCLGVIPFIWFSIFLIILFIGIIHLGYIPKEGNQVDPYKLGLDWLTIALTIFSVGAYIAFFLWIVIGVVLIAFFRKKVSFNRITTILFTVGMLGFFVFRYLFPGVFGWVLD